MESNITEIFLGLYNEFDIFMREYLNVDKYFGHRELIRKVSYSNRIVRKYREDLLLMAELRNLLVHNQNRQGIEFIASPNKEIVELYKKIIAEIMNPPNALSIAIKSPGIFTAGLEDSVIDVMKVMKENNYTSVPIIENKKLIGVFTENTIFSYLSSNNSIKIDKNTIISYFIDYIPLHKHENEVFAFRSKNTTVDQIEDMFYMDLKDNDYKRLAAVFITENGKKDEWIIGMITAWDVAGNKD